MITQEWGRRRTLPNNLEFKKITARKDSSLNAHYIACFPHGGCDVAEIELRTPGEFGALWTLSTGGRLGQVEIAS